MSYIFSKKMKRKTTNIHFMKLIPGIILILLSINIFAQKTISVYSPEGSPMLDFAMNDLTDELGSKGIEVSKLVYTELKV